MLSSITDVAAVRTRGALGSGESAGGATTPQIDAAIELAQDEIVGLITLATYNATRDYDDSATDAQQQQQSDIEKVECWLALAYLPQVLIGQRLGPNGIVSSVTVGTTTTQQATSQDAKDIAEGWRALAMRKIAPYIPVPDEPLDDPESDTGFEDDTFSFIAI